MKFPWTGNNPRPRVIAALIVAVVLAGAATIAVRAATSKDPHLRAAEAEAKRLLSLARLPASAVSSSCERNAALRAPAFAPASDHLIDLYRCWRLPMSFDSAVDWIQKHQPRGLAVGMNGQGDSGVPFFALGYADAATASYRDAQLEISIAAEGPKTSALRIDGIAIWVSSTPLRDDKKGPRIRITINGGCPATLGNAIDVRNTLGDLRTMMLPPDDPLKGMICRYASTSNKGPGIRRIDLGTAEAVRLASAIRKISLGSTGASTHSCPLDTGSKDVIVLRYQADLEVDLWYGASGCRTLDNGDVIAEETGNPSFQGDFADQIAALTR